MSVYDSNVKVDAAGNVTIAGDLTVEGATTTAVNIDSGTLAIDGDNNRVGVGTTAPGVQLEVQDTTTGSANTGGALRLSSDDGAAMGDSHRLGVIEFTGAEDNSNTQTVGARIEAMTDAAWTNAENGAALYFYTTDGNASQTNVLKLDSTKKATFGGAIESTSTTTQQKWSYDADNYATLTVSANGNGLLSTAPGGTDEFIVASTGDLTLDSGDDVILDSYVGKWRLMRNGTLTNLMSATAADGSKMVFDNQVADAGYDFKCSDGGAGITALSIDAANAGLVKLNSSLSMKEAAAAQADTAAYGQLWVKTATPNELYFTTDAGNDIQITTGTAMASAATANDDANLILHMQVFA